MSIRLLVTAGFGNGTFNGTIGDIVTRGYAISTVIPPTIPESDGINSGGSFGNGINTSGVFGEGIASGGAFGSGIGSKGNL